MLEKNGHRFSKIVVPLDPFDPSPTSEEVMASARALAKACNARIIFLVVVEPPTDVLDRLAGLPSDVNLLEKAMKLAAARVKRIVGRINTEREELVVAAGNPSVEIRKLASQQKADVIMVGSHHKRPLSRLLLGSVSDSVAREALQSVWIAKAGHGKIRVIFVPIDGSEGSLEALETAVHLARLMKAKIQPVSIVEYEYVPALSYVDPQSHYRILCKRREKEVAHWIGNTAPKAAVMTPIVKMGHAASDLPRLVKKTNSDLVVMSTHASRGLGFILLGRVAAHMIHRSPCSVFLIHPSGWRYQSV